jgi:outer membrane protein TolC
VLYNGNLYEIKKGNIVKILSLALLFSLTLLNAKELFTYEKISLYLNEENPFISTLLNQEYIAKERVKYHEGAFDTKITGKYDDKDYPATTGEYQEIFLKKKIENGMEFMAGFREAEGTQEYNNIKTGKEGELLAGVKIPVFQLFEGTNSHKIALDVAVIESVRSQYNSKNSLRLFYLQVLTSYYTLLYNRIVLNFEKQLLKKAKGRSEYIEQKVVAGTQPELSLIEAQQQIINREQRLFVATTSYENSLRTFTQYLHISTDEFSRRYELKDALEIEFQNISLDKSVELAKTNRPDLKMLELEKQQLFLKKESANLLKYPDFSVSLYGVHDFKYGDGFKISLGVEFPIERSRYESKMGEYLQSLQNIDNLQERKVRELSTSLQNIINSLSILKENIDNAEKEIELVRKLEKAEKRRYSVGSSTLFLLNQRETYTLDVEKKALRYKLNYLLLKEELNSQIGNNSF